MFYMLNMFVFHKETENKIKYQITGLADHTLWDTPIQLLPVGTDY